MMSSSCRCVDYLNTYSHVTEALQSQATESVAALIFSG
jgi:hypothetical protein